MNQPYSLQFFDGIDPLCAPTETIETHVIIIDLWTLLLIVLIVTLSILFVRELRKKYKPRKEPKHRSAYLTCLLLGILAGLALLFGNQLIAEAHAAQTTPMKTVYNGRLLDSTGHAVTSAQSIRFSYWKSADEISSDIDGAGAINTSATTYANWQEVHVVTPNASGYFSVNLGDIVPLPDMSAMPVSTLLSMYLQVEVKPAVALDTAYEILDTDSTDTAIDRSGVLSVPFAQNADYIDQREIGTGSGSIPLLQSGGLMPIRTVPSGTNQNAFTIDSDNNASGEIALQFGAALGKKLTYDLVANTFKFNAPVEINGNLTVNGLVNGVNLSSLQSSTGALKASSGGGLNLNIAFGSYRLNGNVTNYPGGTLALIGNATNYVFFGSGGIMKNSTGFPTDESFIPVAQVTTSAGSITLIADRRTLQSDDREHTVQQVYSAAFEKTSYQGDGTSNIGQLSVSHDNISLNNFYLWTSTKTALQDYDMLMRLPVSSSFARWRNDGGNYSLTLSYRSTSANATDNKLDIEVFDTNGVPVTLSGTSTGLVSTSWTTVNLNFSASSTWTPGQDMMIRLKVYAKDNFQMQVGSLKLKYVELTKEN